MRVLSPICGPVANAIEALLIRYVICFLIKFTSEFQLRIILAF